MMLLLLGLCDDYYRWNGYLDSFTQIAGPSKWGEYAPDALGKHQSPVVISPADALYEQRLQDSPLKFHYAELEACDFINTGRSVQFNAPAGKCCMYSLSVDESKGRPTEDAGL